VRPGDVVGGAEDVVDRAGVGAGIHAALVVMVRWFWIPLGLLAVMIVYFAYLILVAPLDERDEYRDPDDRRW
jgi:hypothetical protein